MRLHQGGGTWKLQIDKYASKEVLKQTALDLFFPSGASSKGLKDDFHFQIVDFQEHAIPGDITIGQMYQITQVHVLRFYLVSSAKVVEDDTVPLEDT